MTHIRLAPRKPVDAPVVFYVPGSKSATNRLLLLTALAGGRPEQVDGKSPARDSAIMESCLFQGSDTWDIQDAGTAMRFLLARSCLLRHAVTITGTARMKTRPIGDLVDGLRQIGFSITCLEKEGFPPVRISPENQHKLNPEIAIHSGTSSQFVSALMMISPCLPEGLVMNIVDDPVSWPYVLMTIRYMRQFGASVEMQGSRICIQGGGYRLPERILVPADWSSGVFGILSTGLGAIREVFIPALRPEPEQADSQVLAWCSLLGIQFDVKDEGILFRFAGIASVPADIQAFVFDCRNCPDLAPALVVSLALRGLHGSFTGLESLRIKECDRLEALRVGLERCGIVWSEVSLGVWQSSGTFRAPVEAIPTFGDHRIAMAFALVSLISEVDIEEPGVVVKSFPDFWEQWKGMARVLET